jgi:hypothetical protein
MREPRRYAKCGNGWLDVAAMAEKSSGLLIQSAKHRPSNGAPDGHDRLMVGQMTTTKCHRRQGDLPVTSALCRPYAGAQAPRTAAKPEGPRPLLKSISSASSLARLTAVSPVFGAAREGTVSFWSPNSASQLRTLIIKSS